jgi:hypothetical protein
MYHMPADHRSFRACLICAHTLGVFLDLIALSKMQIILLKVGRLSPFRQHNRRSKELLERYDLMKMAPLERFSTL